MNIINTNKLKGVPGIYCITNIENDRFYIGSSIDLEQRRSNHFSNLKKGKHHSYKIQKDYNIFGKDAFVYDVLEVCEKIKEVLITREQFYLDFYDPYYNVLKKADSSMGSKRTDEYKKKMSDMFKGKKWTEEAKAKYSKTMSGRKWSSSKRESMKGKSNFIGKDNNGINNGFYGKKHTDEVKKKISYLRKNNLVLNENSRNNMLKYSKKMNGFKGEFNPMYGKRHSKETLDKIRFSRIGKSLSEETKRKISESNKIRHANNKKNK